LFIDMPIRSIARAGEWPSLLAGGVAGTFVLG